jgi:hypothetical protein
MRHLAGKKRKFGIVLITTLSIIAFLVMLTTMLVTTAYNSLRRASYFYDNEEAMQAALAGLAYVQGTAETNIAWNSPITSDPSYSTYNSQQSSGALVVGENSGMIIGTWQGKTGRVNGFKVCFNPSTAAGTGVEKVMDPPPFISANNLTNSSAPSFTQYLGGGTYHTVPIGAMGVIVEGFVADHPDSTNSAPVRCHRLVEALLTNSHSSSVDSIVFTGGGLNVATANGGTWDLSSVAGYQPNMRPMSNLTLNSDSAYAYDDTKNGTIHLVGSGNAATNTATQLTSSGSSIPLQGSPYFASTDIQSQDAQASHFPRMTASLNAPASAANNQLPGGAYIYWDASKISGGQAQNQVQSTTGGGGTTGTNTTGGTTGVAQAQGATTGSTTGSTTGVIAMAHIAMAQMMGGQQMQMTSQTAQTTSQTIQTTTQTTVATQQPPSSGANALQQAASSGTGTVLGYYPDLDYNNTDGQHTYVFNTDGTITETDNTTSPPTVKTHVPAPVPSSALVKNGGYFNDQQGSAQFDRAVEVTAGQVTNPDGTNSPSSVQSLSILTAPDPTTQTPSSTRAQVNMNAAQPGTTAAVYTSNGAGVTIEGDLTGSGGIVSSGDVSFQGHSAVSTNSAPNANAGVSVYAQGSVNMTPIQNPTSQQDQNTAAAIQQAIAGAMGKNAFTVTPDQMAQVAANVSNSLGNQLQVGSVTYDSRAITSMVQVMIQKSATQDANGNYVVDPSHLTAVSDQDETFYGLIYAYKNVNVNAGNSNSVAIQGAVVAWGGDPTQYQAGNSSTYPGQQAGYAGTGNVSITGQSVAMTYDPSYLGPLASLIDFQTQLSKTYWATF